MQNRRGMIFIAMALVLGLAAAFMAQRWSAANQPEPAASAGSTRSLVVRSSLGGVLMGLANLVPGISGGTMLLAAGVYPAFIEAIAEVTTLRFRLRSVILLGTVVAAAGLAILLLAGLVRTLVIEQRWVMFSLFIGLTQTRLWQGPREWIRPERPGGGSGVAWRRPKKSTHPGRSRSAGIGGLSDGCWPYSAWAFDFPGFTNEAFATRSISS